MDTRRSTAPLTSPSSDAWRRLSSVLTLPTVVVLAAACGAAGDDSGALAGGEMDRSDGGGNPTVAGPGADPGGEGVATGGQGPAPIDGGGDGEVGGSGSGATGGSGPDAGGSGPGAGGSGPGAGGVTTEVVPLYDAGTTLERPVLEDTGSALITRFGDRGRDRHARENEFAAYDHYLKLYWEDRTAAVEIIDTIPHGGTTITFNARTEFKLDDNEAELRFFYRGIGTVAEYHNNGVMTPIDELNYTRTVSAHGATGQPLKVGDHMEFELSQFLDPAVEAKGGRANYYGTTYLYVVGKGLVPWQANQSPSDACPCEGEFSFPIPEEGWLGGRTTLPYQYSNEPRDHFMQMATNLAGDNAQPFVLGRRVMHTNFEDGTHDEDPANPDWPKQSGKLGPRYINESCNSCHLQNTRSLMPEAGSVLTRFVVKVGTATGAADPNLGHVLQPDAVAGDVEGAITFEGWQEEGGLRRPTYAFSGPQPSHYSVRSAPPLVGMGLLEAIPESAVLALADPEDADGDGISGRPSVVFDPVTGDRRLGRFGWKASQASVEHQVAAAFNTDMGVMTDIYPHPDCGAAQDCSPSGSEVDAQDLADLTKYVALLAIRARRDLDDPTALQGEGLFETVGCASCHTTTFQTSQFHPFAELRDQTIRPYTDLLLHDMGPGLADTLPDGTASGAEWRTAPLWSIGLTDQVNGAEGYLHDGRARTLDEAIRWHGGEGAGARDAYLALSASEQDAIVAFLKSL